MTTNANLVGALGSDSMAGLKIALLVATGMLAAAASAERNVTYIEKHMGDPPDFSYRSKMNGGPLYRCVMIGASSTQRDLLLFDPVPSVLFGHGLGEVKLVSDSSGTLMEVRAMPAIRAAIRLILDQCGDPI